MEALASGDKGAELGLAFDRLHDARREIDDVPMATDASGPNSRDIGGFGVTEQKWERERVWQCMAHCEKWRYTFEELIDARAAALGLDTEHDDQLYTGRPRARKGTTDFKALDGIDIGDLDKWTVISFGRWRRADNIFRQEGRAVIMAVRHKGRSLTSRKKRHLCAM